MADRVREQEIKETKTHRDIARYISKTAQERLRRLELLSLALTVLASCSLYVALWKQFPQSMVWIAAVLSTLSAFCSGYLRLRNYLKTAFEAVSLQDRFVELLVKFTKTPGMAREEYRAEHKKLEEECDKLESRSGIRAPGRQAI